MKKIPFEEKIKNAGREVKLSSDESARMLSTLREHVASNPIQEVAPRFAAYQAMFDAFIGYARRPAFAFATLILVVIVSGGAFAYAAQGTLPGDALYALKVGVTEPLVTALTFSTADKIAWQQTLAERRLNEGLSLAKEGKLGTTTEVALATDFTMHADAAETLSDSDSQSGDIAPNDFAPQLSAYQVVLATTTQPDNGKSSTDVLEGAVRSRIALLASGTESRSARAAYSGVHNNPRTASTSTASTSTSVSVHAAATHPHSVTTSTTSGGGSHSSNTSTTTVSTSTTTSTSVTATTTTTTSVTPVVPPVPIPHLPIKLY